MIDKLKEIEAKYEELETKLADPSVVTDQDAYRKITKSQSTLQPTVDKYRALKDVDLQISQTRDMLNEDLDSEMEEMAKSELSGLEDEKQGLLDELKILLLPKDPLDEKNVIVEVRAGTGGEEASLFAGDLLRMYTRYAERNGWSIEQMIFNPTELGGIKESIFMISGDMVYSKLKFESGVHRVQRVPLTEAGRRIHTSAATVAVLPEAEEVDIEISPNDLRIDVFRASGNGGQCVNTTDSAVRITHLPTGLVVSCQDEKSQHKNRDKALKVLRARLLNQKIEEQNKDIAQARKSQVGSGDRSERIRTYNFPQNRVTDHRIGLTLYKLDQVMDGALDELIDALVLSDQSERLKASEG